MSEPFLLVSIRTDDAATEGEREAFLRFGGLSDSMLISHRIDQEPLPNIDVDRFSGIFLGGGPYNVSDPTESKDSVQIRVESELALLLDKVVDTDTPFFGACYGIGTLGTHQGAIVDRTYGEAVGAVEVRLTKAGVSDPLLRGIPEKFSAFVGHKEAITYLPPHAVALATSTPCPTQMFRVGRNVYATQFHPELDIEGLCERMDIYREAGYFDPAELVDLQDMARSSTVEVPPGIVRRFVELYSR